MTANDIRELNDIIKNRDIERYKTFMDYDGKTPIERDIMTLEFESICRNHGKERESPAEFLAFRFEGLMKIACKHGLEPFKICGEFAEQLERRHK